METETSVLAIDDNAELLQSFKLMLQTEYDVRAAEGGEEGLEKLEMTALREEMDKSLESLIEEDPEAAFETL